MLSCCLTSPQWARGCPAAPGRGQEGTEPRSRAHPAPAAPALTFCPDKPWKRKARGGLRGRLPALRTPCAGGAKDLPASQGAQGAPVGRGGQRHPAEGHGDVTHGPDGASPSPAPLFPAPSPGCFLLVYFAQKGKNPPQTQTPALSPPTPQVPAVPWVPASRGRRGVLACPRRRGGE